jgi:hypothetical protein
MESDDSDEEFIGTGPTRTPYLALITGEYLNTMAFGNNILFQHGMLNRGDSLRIDRSRILNSVDDLYNRLAFSSSSFDQLIH